MDNENTSSSSGLGVLVFLFILGWFVYGGLSGGLGLVLLGMSYVFTMLVIAVPVLGLVGYFFLIQFLVKPAVFSVTPLYTSPVTAIVFWVYFAIATILTLAYVGKIMGD